MIQLGTIRLIPLSDGFFCLDGGAMFGIIPKPLWQKRSPADERNRIRLSLNPLLIQVNLPQGTTSNILVDTGLGNFYDEKFAGIYAVDPSPKLLESLKKQAGLGAGDIHFVLLTHLHFDHAGGAVCRDAGGFRPTFPQARYVVQADEWSAATHPNERNAKSYVPETFLPLEEAQQLERMEGEVEIVPGVKVIRTGGHSRGHQIITIESEGEKAIYWGDLIPTTAHISLPYVMGYDIEPETTLTLKKKWLPRVAQEKWISLWDHDTTLKGCYLKEIRSYEYEIEAVGKGDLALLT